MIDPINTTTLNHSYKTVSIFLVEDDDLDAMAVERALKKLKIANPLFRAKHGEEALNLLKANQIPDPMIVLLDLNMPKMNGLELLSNIRADPTLTHLVVFVLTTSKADEDIVASFREHVAGYLVKQNMDKDFLSVINFLDHYWRLVELPVMKRAF